MARLSGPRGREIREESRAYAEEFRDEFLRFIKSKPANEKWLWGREIEDRLTCVIESLLYSLDIEK